MSDPTLEESWQDLRPAPQPPKTPSEPNTPETLTECAQNLYAALDTLDKIMNTETKGLFELRIIEGVNVRWACYSDKGIKAAVEGLLGQANAEIQHRVTKARESRDSKRQHVEQAEAELARVETLANRGKP